MTGALAMAWASALRLARDRTSLFFIFVLPVAVILIVGATVSGFDEFRVGVVDEASGPLGADLLATLEDDPALEVTVYDTVDGLRTDLRRVILDAGVVLPAGMDATIRSGGDVEITVLADQADTGQIAAFSAVAGVVSDHATDVQAAGFAARHAGGTLEANLALVNRISGVARPLEVDFDTVDTESDILPEGFSYSAPTMLVLFVFINSLAAGAAIINTRQLGIYERMLAGPVTTRSIIFGETLVYVGLALFQSALIVGIGAGLFGVSWGDPVAAVVLVGTWALVGTGAGMVSGSLFRTPEQAVSIGPPIGIAFGMLGGCMWPLEIVPPFMQTIGHVVPHGWAVDAWTTLLSRGGALADIGTELLVLGGFAAVLLAVAITRLRSRVVP